MTFTVTPLGLAGLLEIRPHRISDERGFFSETWSSERFREAGLSLAFVQDNHSLSVAKGTLRGLHYQAPPREQDKLVRMSSRRIPTDLPRPSSWDVISSATAASP